MWSCQTLVARSWTAFDISVSLTLSLVYHFLIRRGACSRYSTSNAVLSFQLHPVSYIATTPVHRYLFCTSFQNSPHSYTRLGLLERTFFCHRGPLTTPLVQPVCPQSASYLQMQVSTSRKQYIHCFNPVSLGYRYSVKLLLI